MFADDTTVIKAGERVDNLFRKDVDCMFNWFCFNKLTCNIDICETTVSPWENQKKLK